MCFICSNSSEPAIAGAKFVVSERGDILSPKYAPDIIAPAIIGVGMPRPWPIPRSAIPTVPAVVQELPVARETIEHIIQEATKNILGEMILSP